MGKRGPQPTPTEELQRRGSWRAKTAERQNEIKVAKAKRVPAAPSWLPKDARREYKRIAGVLIAAKMVTVVDADMIAHLAVATVEWVKLLRWDGELGPVVGGEGVPRRNPIYAMRAEAQRDVVRLIRELGMSPASRVGLAIQDVAPKAGDVVQFGAGGGFAT